jgi:SpoU rRNA methylase family enzyme
MFSLGRKVYCVETKLKPNKKVMEAWLGRVKPLGLDKKFLLVVAADKGMEQLQKLQEESGVTVMGLDNLEQTLLDLVKTK